MKSSYRLGLVESEVRLKSYFKIRACILVSFIFHISFCYEVWLIIWYSFYSANLQSRVKKGAMTQEKFEKTFSLLKGVLDYESFKDVDMVIEVV